MGEEHDEAHRIPVWDTRCLKKDLMYFAFFFRNKDAQFLITTGDGKFYSNGIDLEFLGTCTAEEKLKTINAFPSAILRLLTFPVPTIAALNGTFFLRGWVSSFLRAEYLTFVGAFYFWDSQ